MGYLLDTNIVSELRKKGRCNNGVMQWYQDTPSEELWLSVLSLGEIRKGIDSLHSKDPSSAEHLNRWFATLARHYQQNTLPITTRIANRWGELTAQQPGPIIDIYLAATAIEHQLTLVTRNLKDVEHTGCRVLNPFLS